VLWDLPVNLDPLENLVELGYLEFLVQKETVDPLDPKEVQGYRDLEESLESLDRLVIQE